MTVIHDQQRVSRAANHRDCNKSFIESIRQRRIITLWSLLKHQSLQIKSPPF